MVTLPSRVGDVAVDAGSVADGDVAAGPETPEDVAIGTNVDRLSADVAVKSAVVADRRGRGDPPGVITDGRVPRDDERIGFRLVVFLVDEFGDEPLGSVFFADQGGGV